MYAISKLNKQHEQTWVNLQKRLNSVQFQYQKLFTSQDVYQFVWNKAVSVGSCEGYFIPSLLTTTAFVLANNKARVDTTTHKQPLNIMTIFVGYPGTGNTFTFLLRTFCFLHISDTLQILICYFLSNRKIFCHSICSPRSTRKS